MAHPTQKPNCQHCKRVFHSDHRNVTRQRFCSKPECRHASKVDSQQRWRQKPENLDYFKGSVHVERVQQWRREHPGYWRRPTPKASETSDALQETLMPQEMETQALREGVEAPEAGVETPAQDALQEDIAHMARRLQQLGRDILHGSPHATGGSPDAQTTDLLDPAAPRAAAIQLGGSAPGP